MFNDIREEVIRLFGKESIPDNQTSLRECKLLQAAVKETLRLFPSVPMLPKCNYIYLRAVLRYFLKVYFLFQLLKSVFRIVFFRHPPMKGILYHAVLQLIHVYGYYTGSSSNI